MEKEKLAILYSGGLESRWMLHMAMTGGIYASPPLCILANYGQRHIAELDTARKVCEDYLVPYVEVRVELPIRSKLTSGDPIEYDDVSKWYIPA